LDLVGLEMAGAVMSEAEIVKRHFSVIGFWFLAAFLELFAFACARSGPRAVRVGSKNFSEQVLLGEVVAQALEARGVRVDRKLNLGGTFVCHSALVAKALDLYPEYTGTALTAILHEKPGADPAAVRQRVEMEYPKRWALVWAPPLGFENTFALVVRGDDARRLGLRKISDLAAHADLKPGFGYEFVERADGYPGLVKAYGLAFRERPAEMDLGLLYPALEAHRVDVVAGNSTDGLIAAIGGVVLEDDRRYFPPYDAAFVVRGDVWKDRPEVREVLQELAGKLDAAKMRAWNAELDKDKKRPEDVAREVLETVKGPTGNGKR
jgi:osmoprotectant transport system substrate-binding protein